MLKTLLEHTEGSVKYNIDAITVSTVCIHNCRHSLNVIATITVYTALATSWAKIASRIILTGYQPGHRPDCRHVTALK